MLTRVLATRCDGDVCTKSLLLLLLVAMVLMVAVLTPERAANCGPNSSRPRNTWSIKQKIRFINLFFF